MPGIPAFSLKCLAKTLVSAELLGAVLESFNGQGGQGFLHAIREA